MKGEKTRMARRRYEVFDALNKLEDEIEQHERLALKHKKYIEALSLDLVKLRQDIDTLIWVLQQNRSITSREAER